MSEKAYAAVLVRPRTFDFREVPIPDIGPDEGLLRMEAAGLCGTDHEQFDGRLAGTHLGQMPIIPGHEILGWIDRVGAEAARRWDVKEGDRVIVESSITCGTCRECVSGRPLLCELNRGYGLRMGYDTPPHLWGGYASHLYLHPRCRLHKVSSAVPTNVMSLFNPLSNAVRWAWERPDTRAGDTIVIEGPGQRGLLAVMVAREIGAGRIIVTGTSADAHRLSLARELGATATIDVTETDPVEAVLELNEGRKVDVVLDVAAGSTEPILQAVEMIRRGGTIVMAGLRPGNPLNNLVTDKLVLNEIALLGVLSSDWSSTAKAVDIIERRWQELERLCTHAYPIREADKAVRVLGREIEDGPEPVHIHLDTTVPP